jgi:AAA+ superfamily predicted ATPase
MTPDIAPVGITAINNELDWLLKRIEDLVNGQSASFLPLPVPEAGSAYTTLIKEHALTESDRVFLALAFAAVFKPAVLLPFILAANDPQKCIRFGGSFKKDAVEFHPTIRTALYLLCGDDDELFSYYLKIYNRKHRLFKSNLLITDPLREYSSFADHELIFNEQYLGTILHGDLPRLDGEAGFPAKRSTFSHSLADVVLNDNTFGELDKLRRFARNIKALHALPDGRKYRNNFICIFSGDPGTGKSHTAEAIGNELSLPVYKVNFAQLVSKYIGETEKNLERIFDRFSGQPSILFFDEAESIFSKRIEVKDSNDKHSNNEQSFLLQKIEEFDGIVVLATNVQNLSQYFDKAFQRRVRHIITFEFPEYAERLRLWENALGKSFRYEEGLADTLAKNYQLTGGGIYNVISEGIIEALDKQTDIITFEMLEQAMKDEFKKTGRKFEICTDENVMQNPVKRHGPNYEQRKNF